MDASLADDAEDYLTTVTRTRRQLERVNAALTGWEEYDATQHRPPDRTRYVPRPELPCEDLLEYRRDLVDKLRRLLEGH